MIEINWNIFKAKFNGKERSSFENLSYHLFCVEHNNSVGIFRFKNQTGIETEPIQTNEGLVGFQSKYYDTKVTDNKDDIIDSIKKAKSKNPNLSKILYYLNQEFSESSAKEKKDPEYKIEIEGEANKLGLSIEWRVPSHLERQLALPENQYLVEYFFKNGKSIVDFIDEFKAHTENLFLSIQTNILLNEQTIKIDRSNEIKKLIDNLSSPKAIILSGEGGCGKTAIIKELYQKIEKPLPFYAFKAVEFNVLDVKSVFRSYGDYSLNDFITTHENEQQKIVVIDSAERISDLENQESFKEFLSALLSHSWTVIFTTRLSYLDDLRFQLLSVYRLPFEHINISNLSSDELQALATQYSFNLPLNEKMKGIIQNPFYLDEYLRNYETYGNSVQYRQFKDVIWQRKIQNSSYTKSNTHIQREKCFLSITKIRSEQGSFYVSPTNCTDEILSLLLKDDIIGYDKNSGGYFITHDIYEEWGLDILIERAFNSVSKYDDFFREIGTSLVVRRAFRQWLSDKLFDSIENIKTFIENSFESEALDSFWKDEILTSVLLSDYSKEFFARFKDKIIADNFSVLKKIIFLLRVSCKSVDDSISKRLKDLEDISLKYIFTKPKGLGWNSTIDFIYEQQNLFTVSKLSFIIPLLSDWCNNYKRRETTRKAGLFALKFYSDIQNSDEHRYSSKLDKQLISIIIDASNEIKEELVKIFDTLIATKDANYETPYFELGKKILDSDNDNLSIIVALPEYVLKLADFFWYNPERNDKWNTGFGVETEYGIKEFSHQDYFPSSAYQTPVYWLLFFLEKKKTIIDFIIDFTNKTVKNYVASRLGNDVREIELAINENRAQKQYISGSLWGMYRGSGSPVTPYLLQSMHMALEKHFLEAAAKYDAKLIESWLIYLIEKSNSASITSVVTSIVLAYPDKFFNVAKILFSCSPLFLYDNARATIGEHEAKSVYSIGHGLTSHKKIFEDERLKTCEDKHRSHSLENLIVNYQFFRNESISEGEAEQRKQEIWKIIDKHYSELPDKSNETDDDKTTRLLLARIDRRKMNPQVEMKENHLIIDFSPKIDPDLEIHREEALKESNERMQYTALNLWGNHKFNNSKKCEDYPQYEKNPQLVLKEVREIEEKLKDPQDEYQKLMSSSIPAFACSALIRESAQELTQEDKQFCANIILQKAISQFASDYQYQISDGVEVSINALPSLMEILPDKKEECLLILLLTLFDHTPIGEYKLVRDYSIESIQRKLWEVSYDNASIVLWGFLKYKSVFDSVAEKVKASYAKQNSWPRPRHSQSRIIKFLIESSGNDIEKFISSPLLREEFDISKYSLSDLGIVFQLIPYDTSDERLLEFVYKLLPVFASKLLNDRKGREQEIDHRLRCKIFKRFSYFILHRTPQEIPKYIQPFVDNFLVSEAMSSLFEDIVATEDMIAQYEQFWIIWELFYEKICASQAFDDYRFSGLVHNYLLAWRWWKETAHDWRSLKEREKTFFKKVVRDIGHWPSVLDSIAQFLNQIGSGFLNEGVFWINEMVEKNKENKLEVNTVYYIEKLVRKYIYLNRMKVKQDVKIKNRILTMLNFLVEHGSVNAYLLREDIL